MTPDTNSQNKPQQITLQYTPGAQDWQDPCGTDNAMNQCSLCRWMFWGHKSRVVCRTCTEKAARETESNAPAPVPWAAEREHFAKGGKIQFRDKHAREDAPWNDTDTPQWNDTCVYRIKPEDLTPDRCPTCGSVRRAHSYGPGYDGPPCDHSWHQSTPRCPKCGCTREAPDNEHCRNSFHQPSDAAAKLAPKPWRPKFRVDQQVRFDGECMFICAKGPNRTYDLREFGCARIKYTNVPEDSIEPYVWTMPTPPAGHEWHRNDFTEEMLPPGTRPLCLDEPQQLGDEWLDPDKKEWVAVVPGADGDASKRFYCHRRTTRPAPTPPQAETTAQTDGKPPRTAGEALYNEMKCRIWEPWDNLLDALKENWERRAQAVLAFAQSSENLIAPDESNVTYWTQRILDVIVPDMTDGDVAFVIRELLTKDTHYVAQSKGFMSQAEHARLCLRIAHLEKELAQSSRTEPKPFPTPQDVMQAASKKPSRMEQASGELGGTIVPYVCVICGTPIGGTMIGAGDGAGSKFAHPECWYRQRAEAAEQTIADLRRENAEHARLADLRANAVVKLHQEIEQLKSDLTAAREELGKANQHAEDVFERYTEGVLKMVRNLGSKAEIDTSPGETEHETRGHILARAEDAIQALLDEARESLRKAEGEVSIRDATIKNWERANEAIKFNLRKVEEKLSTMADATARLSQANIELTKELDEAKADAQAVRIERDNTFEELQELKASSGWVALSERRPTREDCTPDEYRVVLFTNGTYRAMGHHDCVMNCGPDSEYDVDHIAFLPTHWMSIPPLPTPPPSPEEQERKVITVHDPIPDELLETACVVLSRWLHEHPELSELVLKRTMAKGLADVASKSKGGEA